MNNINGTCQIYAKTSFNLVWCYCVNTNKIVKKIETL